MRMKRRTKRRVKTMSKLFELYDTIAHNQPIINPLINNFIDRTNKITIEEWNTIFGDYAKIVINETGKQIIGNFRLYELFVMRECGSLMLNDYFKYLFDGFQNSFSTQDDNLRSIQYICLEFLNANIDKYKRLYEIEIAKFNPIENYDRYEDEQITDGTRTDKSNYGQIDNSTIIQPFSVSSNNGERINTTLNGELNKQTVNSVVGYNSEQAKNRNLVDETTNQNTITNTQSASVDTVSTDVQNSSTLTNAHNDEFIKGEQKNNKTSHIHGNIGVTTAPEMLSEYKDFYTLHRNIIITMLNDFVEYATNGIYE